ncbi:MAG: glycosyltransferase family 4 protein [Candidatus Nanoarchaeia archaeon]|nr:glycosyltransferase family 4 protein [Candidatus Nanoarchaeia archaeon]
MKTQQYLLSLLEKGKNLSDGTLKLLDALGKPKLKVAMISYYYQKPTISGVGIHVQNLAKNLIKHNCEVHIFCQGNEYGFYKENGIIVHTIGKILTTVNDNFSKKRLEYDIFESEVVKEIIRENSKRIFDIIHTHGALTKAAFILRKVYNIKWIHTFHAIEKLRIKKLSNEERQFEDLISWIEHTVNYCDGSIFVSNDLLKEGVKNYNLKSKIIIPNGVDLQLFNYYPLTKKNVLFIGRFSKDKGIDIITKLIPPIMSIKDVTFTAICPGSPIYGELGKIRKDIYKMQIKYGERLKIIDKPQDQQILKNLYRNCQIYIQPSKYESFGLCILEAMITGRPVVAFKVGGIPEVIGDAGFTVTNRKEFIYTVKELLKNKNECIMVGKKAYKKAKKFDWDLIAQETIKYYEKVKNE